MSKQVEFGEIDFEAIEYRNEYRHTKSVFPSLAAQAYLLWYFGKTLFEGDLWLALLGGSSLGLFVFLIAYLFIQYTSRVIITGQSLILKRPLIKDVEIAYWEVGEVQVNGMVIRESYDDDSSAIDLSAATRRWPAARHSMLKFWSRDRKRKINVHQSLESFDRFCDDLTERWRSAIDRYLGYAKGINLRQPERYLNARETLKTQREQALLKARSSSEIQKAGATKSE
jgi:hypothetical protein